ncbi:ABC transporter ATP-binding protein [Acuticoccus yangtzensis]|uniref:ABC transporter ATP-binding protein n=1 Tax=Acuticoccus yangtzensis TaxID=1443441 RepID=UPI00094969E4|nr:ABC transporter ATP-binding protein [Acuticoccus yangtzensis]ORE95747.1 branched-chain amino acid ABC transporter ATP-binding protein [Stappia sp. 22II-S9-Z10]
MLEVTALNTFYGGAHILRDVTLAVGPHEVLALLGRNGAGKSTTMRSVMGLVRPRSGRVTFAGADMTGAAPYKACRAGLGYVPEDRRVFRELTVAENLEVGRREARPDAPSWSVDQLFGLFPNLAERRGTAAGRLSGGEQQMLTIARTLMGNPRLILLDEPSEGISPLIVEQMAQVIGEMKSRGLAVMVSEQNLHFARLVADRAVIIEKGEVRFEGTFAALDAAPEIARETLAL